MQFGLSTRFANAIPSRGSIHYEMLEAIDDFETKDDPAVFRGLDGLTHALNGSIGEDPLVFAGQKLARPRAVIDSRHDCASHVFHRLAKILEQSNAVFPYRRILRYQVHILGHSDAVSETQTRLRGGGFERVQLCFAHASDFLSADFKDVEASLAGSCDERELVDVPILRPISEMYSYGIHDLSELGFVFAESQVTTLSMPPSTK